MKIIFVFAFIILFIALNPLERGFCQEEMTITTYFPSPVGSFVELRANKASAGIGSTPGVQDPVDQDKHFLSWGTQRGGLKSDTVFGASIELGGESDQPYIDFTNSDDTSTDYDIRIQLDYSDALWFRSKIPGQTVHISNASSCIRKAYDPGPYTSIPSCVFASHRPDCPDCWWAPTKPSPVKGITSLTTPCPSTTHGYPPYDTVYQLTGLIYPWSSLATSGYFLCCEYEDTL